MSGRFDDALIGSQLGGCTIHRLIARGGVGALYGAIEHGSDAARAVKVLRLASDFDAGDRQEAERRFAVEAAIAQRLDHPDIVRIHRSGTEGDSAYLVMDLLAGTDLQRYVQPGRLLPVAAVPGIGLRIARALRHAHELGVVHRDLKPANVMVDWPTRRVTLTDFGLARTVDAQCTRTGLVLGSPAYMAPELLSGLEPSISSDLYALGVLMFQLVSGRLPFEASGLGELLRQVAHVEAPALARLQPEVPPGLGSLVCRLLAKSSTLRPASAGEVAQCLLDLCHD